MKITKNRKKDKPIIKSSVIEIEVKIKEGEQVDGKIYLTNIGKGKLKGQIFSPLQAHPLIHIQGQPKG